MAVNGGKFYVWHVTPAERRTTELTVQDCGHAGVEIIVDQSVYKILNDRYAPRKLLFVTLSRDQVSALLHALAEK